MKGGYWTAAAAAFVVSASVFAAYAQGSRRSSSGRSQERGGQQGAGAGGGRGGEAGSRPGGGMRPPGNSVINLDSVGWVDAAENARLEELLKNGIAKHNAQLLKEYDANGNGKIDADEAQKIKQAISSRRMNRRGGPGGGGFGPGGNGGPGGNRNSGGPGGDGSSEEGRPPAPPEWGDGEGGNGGGNRMGPPPGGFGGGEGESSAEPTGVLSVSGKSETRDGAKLDATKSDESAALATNGGELRLSKVAFTKTGDASSEQGSNFTGLNAIVLASGNGRISIDGGTVSSDASGANGLFAAGPQASISAKNLVIKTTQNSSRGLDATRQGTIVGERLTISTEGAHCACLATDRGEGTVTVTATTGTTRGEGSPGIYSTGAISATGSSFEAFGSEAAVIEGKNSITLVDTAMTGHLKCGMMLYQSFSGDAGEGTSIMKMKGGSLTAKTGPLFKITNTRSEIFLDGVALRHSDGIFISAKADRWGRSGRNGGYTVATLANQKAAGDVVADSISGVTLVLDAGSAFSGTLNASGGAETMALVLKPKAAWSVGGDSHLTKLDFGGDKIEEALSRIQSNGHTVSAANIEKSYALPGGGKLVPAK